MKNFKRIFAIFMVMIMALALVAPAAALETRTAPLVTASVPGDGKITLNNLIVGQQYNLYQLATLESYDPIAGHYAYRVCSEQIKIEMQKVGFSFQGNTIIGAPATSYGDPQSVADTLLKYVEANANIIPVKTIEATSSTIEFDELPLGYYLIDSSVGTLCRLTTVTNEFVTTDKNAPPSITKLHKVKNKDANFAKYIDAPIGATILFQLKVIKAKGAINYIIADTFSEAFDYYAKIGENVNLNVYTLDPDDHQTIISMPYGTPIYPNTMDDANLKTTLESDAWFKGETIDDVALALAKKSAFMIKLDNTALAALPDGTEIFIEYEAKFNEKAKIALEEHEYDGAGKTKITGNPNDAFLYYGKGPYLMAGKDRTLTYTWDMNLFKYTGNNIPLANAIFAFFAKTTETEVPLYLKSMGNDSSGVPVYMANASVTAPTEGYTTQIKTDATGRFKIVGIDVGTFVVREIAAPVGYTKIGDISAVMTATWNAATGAIETYGLQGYQENTVKVLNGTSAQLPETGGTGTIIFIAVGSFLVVLMGMLLVVKKRMTKVTYIDR